MSPSLRPSFGSLAALTAAIALPSAAKSQVVMSALSNVSFVNESSVDLDIDGNGTADFKLFANSYSPLYNITPYNLSRIFANGSYVRVFDSGETIGFGATGTYQTFDTIMGSTGYVGVNFERDGQLNAAWLFFDFSAGGSDPSQWKLTSAAWESTAGASITAGASAIPEPAQAAVGLGLVAGMMAWLRRRRVVPASAA